MDFPHLEKAPIPLAHEHPIEPPHGPAPRSPLRVLALALVFILGFLAFLWAIDLVRDDPAEQRGPDVTVTVDGVTCPEGTRPDSRCFVGVVTDRSGQTRALECSWTSADDPFRHNGGSLPVGPLPASGSMTSKVLVVHGGDSTPTIECVG
jgi:hypothetical protein